MDGRLVIAPFGGGFAAFGLYNILDTAGTQSEARRIEARIVARRDGRLAIPIDGHREGVHAGQHVFALAPPGVTLDDALGRDFVYLLPSADVLSAASGVYTVSGNLVFTRNHASTTNWEGTIGVVETGFTSKRTRAAIVALVIHLMSPTSDYGARTFTAMGELDSDGRLTADPQTLISASGFKTTLRTTGYVEGGTLHVTIEGEAPDDRQLSHRFTLDGTKSRP